MQSFIDYLINEYKDKVHGYVAIDTKFTHTSSIKIDKFSPPGCAIARNVPLKNNVIF